jgi:hypothetical protein
VIDDYPIAPTGRRAAEMEAKLDRIITSISEGAARGRMNRQLQLLNERPPFAMLLTSGEDLPRGFAQRSRIFVVEVEDKEVKIDKLSEMQKHGKSGLLSIAMAEYIKWLAIDLPGR